MPVCLTHKPARWRIRACIIFSILFAPVQSQAADARQVTNPFDGATGYINPDYAERVMETRSTSDSGLAAAMTLVAKQPTAVWLDSLDAIDGYDGLRLSLEQHLVNAVEQQKKSQQPLTFLVVLYALPNRDCAAHASNGTLHGNQGLQRYKEEFVDRITALFQEDRFASVRIVTLIEPDSLPNLVTNLSNPGCQVAAEQGLYTDAIAYALNQFSTISNVYSYLDFGHAGWLGWDVNRARAVQLYSTVVEASGSLNNIHGVVTNVSGYTPVEELLLPDPDYSIEGSPVKSARFYEYNSKFDERDYAVALYADFVAAGFSTSFGVLIDTSRNGWGGESRPDAVGWRSDVDAYVDASRFDRRPDRGHWCNQAGAGLGERPRANPYSDDVVHAFVWAKPPGESDGISDPKQTTPDAHGKSFDANCDPNGTTTSGLPTGALANAPAAGAWFAEQFEMLVRNAFPPLP